MSKRGDGKDGLLDHQLSFFLILVYILVWFPLFIILSIGWTIEMFLIFASTLPPLFCLHSPCSFLPPLNIHSTSSLPPLSLLSFASTVPPLYCLHCPLITIDLSFQAKGFHYNNRTMDLPFPSQKDVAPCPHPAHRKASLMLRDSLPNIPCLPPLPVSLKRELQTLIRNDYAFELRELVERAVVSMHIEVGREGSQENLLHLTCRQNAVNCLEYLLKTYYQYFPAEYEWWLNSGSHGQLTPAMLCAVTGAVDCLRLLLEVGGVDIHLIDANKLSTYQIALNSKNEEIVKMLLQYESKPKRCQLINREFLAQSLELLPARLGIYHHFYACLLDCFTGGTAQEPGAGQDQDQNRAKGRARGGQTRYSSKGGQTRYSNSRHSNTRYNGKKSSFLEVVGSEIEGYFMEKVELGLPKELLAQGIEWRLLGDYQQKGSIEVLFDTFSPFDIEDIWRPNQNLLIVLQSLSQHPWLVRRAIQADRSSNGHYLATLYYGHLPRVIEMDSHLPFVVESGEPAFLADKKEGWPMLLQKALAKHYGSYTSLETLGASELIETLTGWPVVRRQINEGGSMMQTMQRVNSMGYMYVLEGRHNSLLSCPSRPDCCFTVLTFYAKGSKRMVLVNCPFVDAAWVEKESHEILALKILRGHYNCRQQMTIWIDEHRLKDYFTAMLVVPLQPGHNRYTLQATVNSWLYFRVTITNQHEQPPIFYLVDSSSTTLSLNSTQGWANQTDKVRLLPPEFLREEMMSFEAFPGSYLFRTKVDKGRYSLVAWALEEVRLETVEESFGEIEWINCLRGHQASKWDALEDEEEEGQGCQGQGLGCQGQGQGCQGQRLGCQGQGQGCQGQGLGCQGQGQGQGCKGYVVLLTGECTLVMSRVHGWITGADGAEVVEGSVQSMSTKQDEQGMQSESRGRVRLVEEEGYSYCVLRGQVLTPRFHSE